MKHSYFLLQGKDKITDEVTLFYPMREENKLNFINSSEIYVIQILRSECFTSKWKEKRLQKAFAFTGLQNKTSTHGARKCS